MQRSKEIESQRLAGLQERAEMQKLSVVGHLLPGADISARNIERFLDGLGPICGMTTFNGPHVKSPDSYDEGTFKRLGEKAPEDVNGTLMWDDSGAQIYVFPTKGNWFTLDVYTCKTFDPEKVLEYTYSQLHPQEDMRFAESTSEENSSWRQFTPAGVEPSPEKAVLLQVDTLFDVDRANTDAVLEAGELLEKTVYEAIENGYGERLVANYTKEQRDELRDIHSAFEITMDAQFMDAILSGEVTSPDEYSFQPIYDRLSRMEGEAIGPTEGKPVIHIGTGWPGTAIGLYRQFGIPVTCVEIDPLVAQRSRDALEKLDLLGEDKLTVINADGAQLNPDRYHAVIVSAMVPNEDKEEIVRNMRHLAGENASGPLLVLRRPADHARSIFYQEPGNDVIDQQGLIETADTGSTLGNQDPLRSTVFRVKEMASIHRDGLLMARAMERLRAA